MTMTTTYHPHYSETRVRHRSSTDHRVRCGWHDRTHRACRPVGFLARQRNPVPSVTVRDGMVDSPILLLHSLLKTRTSTARIVDMKFSGGHGPMITAVTGKDKSECGGGCC